MARLLLLVTDLLIGGTPTVVRELALRLKRDGVDLEVASLGGWGPVAEQLRQAGVQVTALNARGPADIRVFGRLLHLVRSGEVTTILSFLVHANVAASYACLRMPEVRLIQSIQTTQPYPRWHWWVQRLARRWADAVIVPTESVATVARERAGVSFSRLWVIPNAIDVDRFSGIEPLSMDDRPTTIGFLGRLDPVKRLPDLILAMQHLPDAVLNVYGAGNEEPAIHDLIAREALTSRVTLHGEVASPEQAFAGMSVLVLPSEAEGFGLVLIEAMAAGVPVVATDVPGIRDVVVNGETGLLVPVASPAALAQAISRLRDDRALRLRLTTNAKQYVAQRFAWGPILRQYREILAV